jgi:TM2 domain-containing membrane protein YozV
MCLGAVAAGVLGLASTFLMYWMIVPGVVLGLVAIGLGVKSLRQGQGAAAAVAVTLGVVGLLAIPAFLVAAEGAEDWGRDCALDPTHDPNC